MNDDLVKKQDEKPFYNPPKTARQSHVPAWMRAVFDMFSANIRPEQRRNFSWGNGSSGGGGHKPGYKAKSIMKRRRLRDIARVSRRRNRRAA